MTSEPSSQAIGSSVQNTTPPSRFRYPRFFLLAWFFAGPVIVPYLAVRYGDSGPFDFILVLACMWLWVGSCYMIYDRLFAMAEVRWPAAKVVRQISGFAFYALMAIAQLSR